MNCGLARPCATWANLIEGCVAEDDLQQHRLVGLPYEWATPRILGRTRRKDADLLISNLSGETVYARHLQINALLRYITQSESDTSTGSVATASPNGTSTRSFW